MRKPLNASLAFFLTLFAGAQFVRPARDNPPAVAGQSIEELSPPPADVSKVLNRSCMDCHSNRTVWPWYSNVSPVSWFLKGHVDDGRRHLNFSRWAYYDLREKAVLLDEICKTAKGGTMPLGSYTLIHRGAVLKTSDVSTLCRWSGEEQRRLTSPAPDAR